MKLLPEKKVMRVLWTNWIRLCAGLVFFMADQFIKKIVAPRYGAGNTFFNYTLNEGLVFGLKPDGISPPVIVIFNILAVAVLVFLIARAAKKKGDARISALIMLTAGAASNLLDRLSLGAVVDYIDLKFFPVFNLADILISVGCFLFLINEKSLIKNKTEKI